MPIFQPFIKLPDSYVGWNELTVAQGGQYGLVDEVFRSTIDLDTSQEFQLVPVCPGRLYCQYEARDTFGHIATSELNDFDKLSDEDIYNIQNANFTNLPVPQPIPDSLLQLRGKIKVILRPNPSAHRLIRDVFGVAEQSRFGEVLYSNLFYFQYDSVDISSLQSSMLPIIGGPLEESQILLDQLSEVEIFQLFLLGLISVDIHASKQGDNELPPDFNLGHIGQELDSSSTRTIRFSAHTEFGPIDPLLVLHTLKSKGHLVDDEKFLESALTTSTFSYGNDTTGNHTDTSKTSVPKELFLNTLTQKFIYPFSILKDLRRRYELQNEVLSDEEWRMVGDNQKQLFAQRLRDEPLGNFLEADAKTDWKVHLNNVFLLEALIEHTCVETVDEWEKGNRYEVGMMVRPTTPNGYWYHCVRPGKSGDNDPEWTSDPFWEPVDGDVRWKWGGVLDERDEWRSGETYFRGDIVRPQTPNGYWFYCLRGHISDNGEPVWADDPNWERGGILNSKKVEVDFLSKEQFVRRKPLAMGKGEELVESDIYLVLIDRLKDLGAPSPGISKVRLKTKKPKSPGDEPQMPIIDENNDQLFDEYEGVMIVIANGEVQTRLPGFSSLTSRRNERAASSTVEGNRKYRFASSTSTCKKGINYAFLVTDSPSSVYKKHGEHIPGWYYWGQMTNKETVTISGKKFKKKTEGTPGRKDADGKEQIFIHRGIRSPWNGSEGCIVGCIVKTLNQYYEMRNELIDIWQSHESIDWSVQAIRSLVPKRSERAWTDARTWVDGHNKNCEESDRTIRKNRKAKRTNFPSEEATLWRSEWDDKIIGTLFVIRPDEYETIRSGERRRFLRRLGLEG